MAHEFINLLFVPLYAAFENGFEYEENLFQFFCVVAILAGIVNTIKWFIIRFT